MTGLQMELGAAATEFEHRTYGDELASCQRYFERIGGDTTFTYLSDGYMHTTTIGRSTMPYQIEKRTIPTGTFTAASNFGVLKGSGNVVPSAVSALALNRNSALLSWTLAASTLGEGINLRTASTAAYVDIDAEL